MLIKLDKLPNLINNGTINMQTIYCNNTVLTKNEFDKYWLIPIAESWLKNKLLKTI